MGMVFEGSMGGIMQNVESVNTKAKELSELIDTIAKEVLAIDEQIRTLAENGLKGSAMTDAVNKYVENREVIDVFVKKFAATACTLSESAIAHSNINEDAAAAARGTMQA